MSENLFITYFPLPNMKLDGAFSVAGDRVQDEIRYAISNNFGQTECLVMPVIRAFPHGKLWLRSLKYDEKTYMGIINFPIVKMASFSAVLFFNLLRSKPKNIFIWNSYLFQNISIFIYKTISRNKPNVIIFVQDVQEPRRIRDIQFFLDMWSLRIINWFCDLCIPVTKDILVDFKIKTRSIIAIGGVSESDSTEFKTEVKVGIKDSNYYVMGGALEPYNGTAKIASVWPSCGSAGFLNIYGSGSEASRIEEISRKNCYVRFFGKVRREEYLSSAISSLGVIVLRYSEGLDSKYFFPSKFLEACNLNVNIICNKFINFPEQMSPFVNFVSDDLSNLESVLVISKAIVDSQELNLKRIDFVRNNYTWDGVMKSIKMEICR